MSKLVILLAFFTLLGCEKRPEKEYSFEYSDQARIKTLIFGVHPLHNPSRLYKDFSPLVQEINKRLKHHRLILEASNDYADFDRKMASGHFSISLPNPYQTMLSISQGYEVFGKMGDDDNFRGIIVTRKDSAFTKVEDLKGKTLCFPAPTALAATMMPQYFLFQKGLNLKKNVTIKYVGSQESSIMATFNKTCAASGTWPLPWKALKKKRKKVYDELKIQWQTSSLPNNGLVYKKGLDKNVLKTVKEVIFNLDKSEHGKAILEGMELNHFEKADNGTYQVIADYIKNFSQKVRHPKDPI